MLNEFEVKDKLKKDGENIHTDEDLINFINNIKENYNYDYGVAPRAIAQAGIATMNYLLCEMGCSGFQANCSVWDVIEYFINIKVGAKIIRYDDMLYPQYEYKFNSKEISESIWRELQKEASEKLAEDNDFAHPDVLEHWHSIVNGVVPFGYTVVKEGEK